MPLFIFRLVKILVMVSAPSRWFQPQTEDTKVIQFQFLLRS